MQDKKTDIEVSHKREKGGKKLLWGILTAIVSLVLLVFYRVSLSFPFFPYVMWGYMIILTVLVIVYILYNRGFTRRGVDVDMLPEDWSEEKRIDFVENGRYRLASSKWMLMLIIGFLVTFLFDALELFVLKNLF